MITYLVLPFLFCSNSFGDQANPFEHGTMSSEAVATSVESCMASASEKVSLPENKKNKYLLLYCGCMTDALIKYPFVQAFGMADRCSSLALNTLKNDTDEVPKNLFDSKKFPSVRITGMYHGCKATPTTNPPSFDTSALCSCLVDGARTHDYPLTEGKLRDVFSEHQDKCAKLSKRVRK